MAKNNTRAPAGGRTGLGTGGALLPTLLWVLVVAAIPRLLALASFPLVITNDGEEYLRWAAMIADGGFGEISFRPDRTPGYSLFLAGAIELLGRNALAILIAQHVLGCVAALAVAWCGYALSGPRAALVAGVLAAVDPWMFALESFALSEVLATTLACLLAALALNGRPGGVPAAIGIGAVSGALLLVRPAFQVFVPLCIAAWLLRPVFGLGMVLSRSRRWAGAAVVLVVLLALLVPWMRVHHARHGGWRLARGSGAHLWAGLARTGTLSQSYPLEPEIAEAFAPFRGQVLTESMFWTFFKEIDGVGKRAPLLRAWALASVRENPRAYLREAVYAAGWQLNRGPGPAAAQESELDWILVRSCAVGSGVNFEGSADHVEAFLRGGTASPTMRFMRKWAAAQHPGIPQVPLAVAAVLLLLAAVVRRRWRVVLVVLATMVFLLVHAALLMPNGRYSVPMWMIWYAALAALPGFVLRERSARAGPPVVADNETRDDDAPLGRA